VIVHTTGEAQSGISDLCPSLTTTALARAALDDYGDSQTVIRKVPRRSQCERDGLPVQVADGIRPSQVTRRAAAPGALPRLAARL
jgi:hypothetical protein